MFLGKNQPLPRDFSIPPYSYMRFLDYTIIWKNSHPKFLEYSDQASFFRAFNRAKQQGRSLQDVFKKFFGS